MTFSLIDNEIINVFFKFYKKDIKSISPDIYDAVADKISQNVEKLIDEKDAKKLILQKFSDYEFSFLHVVAKFGIPKDLKKIIEIIGLKNLDQTDINNFTALHHCAISGRLNNAKVLIGLGAKLNAKSSDDTRNWCPIHYACKYGFKEIVEELIDAGVDKEITTSFGLTPLHVACEFGHPEIAKYLIKVGCDLDPKTTPENHKLTPLHYAVMINSIKTVEILFDSGADIYSETLEGSDALILATKRNYAQIVSYLIDRGVVDNIEDARMIAVKNNYLNSKNILESFIDIRNRLFDKSELIKLAKNINDFVAQIKPQNFDESYFDLSVESKISPYFLAKITKKIGVIKKRAINLETYADELGLDVLSKNLKKLSEIISHKKLMKKY